MKYRFDLTTLGGRPFYFFLDLTGEDLKAEEYKVMQKAKELYRDAMHQRGLWPLPGARNN